MRRAALAAAAFALLAAAPGGPANRAAHATPAAHQASDAQDATPPPEPRTPLRTVHAFVVSGTPQSGRAYAAPGETKYQTEFADPLVVRIVGAPKQKQKRHVHFTCETKGCAFGAIEQPNKGEGIDHKTDNGDDYYIAEVNNGKAAIRVAIKADSPSGTYTVLAVPDRGYGERTTGARFTLTSH